MQESRMCDALIDPMEIWYYCTLNLWQFWHWMWSKNLGFYHPAFELVTFNSFFHTLALPLFVTLFVTLSILCLVYFCFYHSYHIYQAMSCIAVFFISWSSPQCKLLEVKGRYFCVISLTLGHIIHQSKNSPPGVSQHPGFWEIVTINIIIFSQPPDVKVTHISGREGQDL